MMITDLVEANISVEASVAATKKMLDEDLDFAFLDIDVTNAKTFEIAKILERKRVPFVFVSGSRQAELPFELHSAPRGCLLAIGWAINALRPPDSNCTKKSIDLASAKKAPLSSAL